MYQVKPTTVNSGDHDQAGKKIAYINNPKESELGINLKNTLTDVSTLNNDLAR
jgi:hypothetical protein